MENEKLPVIEFESQVIEIKTETPTTKTLVFDISDIDFNFYPGQYVMLQVPYPPTGEILKEVPNLRDNLYYLCGPPAFVDDMASILEGLGVEKDRIKKEKYD